MPIVAKYGKTPPLIGVAVGASDVMEFMVSEVFGSLYEGGMAGVFVSESVGRADQLTYVEDKENKADVESGATLWNVPSASVNIESAGAFGICGSTPVV